MSTQKLIPPPPSSDLLIHSLKHHAPDNSDPNVYALCKNPFEEINASEELSKGQKVLDYDSEPDSEAEDALYETQWGDADQEFAEPQTIDHEMEYSDIVDRAGAYTGEEILKISIEKATKLHSLYCSQLNQLRHIYIDKKRQYLQDLKKEKELYCSIHNQKKTSVEEMRRYKLLKASISYGRKHRLDAILAKREHEKRLGGKQPSKSKMYKCYFQDDGVRCFAICIPLTKFCARHILMDKRQVLFRACGAPFNNTTCTNPVLVTVKDKYCTFHRTYRSVLEREQREMIETIKNEVQTEDEENNNSHETIIDTRIKARD
uniref:KAT8 regulatory NSL complex subunit 2 n=2 Tax=Cacopsylla melanoneura TaxID=428564 RepID=A0A8D8Y8I4_9HEMI